MNIFNSLGSNYTGEYVIKSLFKKDEGSKAALISFLENKYKGRAQLTYKGREAITLALESLNLSKGAGVAVNAFTCVAVVEAIEEAGLTPIYLDIDPDSLHFTSSQLQSSFKKYSNIKVVMIQNTLGYPCDIEEINKVCKKENATLIEDLAHSVGTIYKNGVEAGTVGDFTVLSFGQDKVIDAVSGGAVVTRNEKYTVKNTHGSNVTSTSDKAYPLLTFIIRKTYALQIGKVVHLLSNLFSILPNPMKPHNSTNMTNWHAMLALDEFRILEKNLNHKREIAKIYCETLNKNVVSPYTVATCDTATHLRFPIFYENRDALIEELKKHKAYLSSVWYKNSIVPIHEVGLAKYPKILCPISDSRMLTVLNLPTHINTSVSDAKEIANSINDFLKQHDSH